MIRYKRYVRPSWWMLMGLILSLWSWQIVTGRMPSIDQWSLTWIERVEQTQLYIFARFITNFGSDFFLVPFTLLMGIGLIFLNRDWLQAFIFSGGTLMTYFLNAAIKGIIARERPSINVSLNAEGYSFPSGHAMISLVCYGLFFYFLIKHIFVQWVIRFLSFFFGVLVFCIGMSRYIIHVHYLTDILTGFLIGYWLLLLIISFYEWLVDQRRSFVQS